MANTNAPVVPYSLEPPSWKQPWQDELGWPDFYRPQHGQDENSLTENAVKHGYSNTGIVQTENFSPHGLVSEKISEGSTVNHLQRLFAAVSLKRDERGPQIGTHSFKLPSRVTLNEQKRELWISELANSTVPLSKLGKSVPHGYRGEKLLDMLSSKKVPLDRAIWYIRAIGANEIKNRPNMSSLQYSTEWTGVVTEYFRKQLNEISLPSAPQQTRPGMTFKTRVRHIFSDPATRNKWTARFSYTIQLTASLFRESLIDRSTFFEWTLFQLGSCNPGQLPFVIYIAEPHLDHYLKNEALCRSLVSSSLGQLAQLEKQANPSELNDMTATLKGFVRASCLACPHSFVYPPLWNKHGSRVQTVVMMSNLGTTTLEHDSREGDQKPARMTPRLVNTINRIRDRNKALLYAGVNPISVTACSTARLRYVAKILDSLPESLEFENAYNGIFGRVEQEDTLEVQSVLSWAVTSDRFSPVRPFAASRLLSMRESRKKNTRCLDLQVLIVRWLDSETQIRSKNAIAEVSRLVAELTRRKLFSLVQYEAEIIARGDNHPVDTEASPSLHIYLLRAMPLHPMEENGQSLGMRRQDALRRFESFWKKAKYRMTRLEVLFGATFPGIFSEEPLAGDVDSQTYTELMTAITAKPLPGEVSAVLWDFVLPKLRMRVKDPECESSPLIESVPAPYLYVLADSIILSKDFVFLSEVLDIVFRSRPSQAVADAACDILETHWDIWVCMDLLLKLGSTLVAAYEYQMSRQSVFASVAVLLLRFTSSSALPPEIASSLGLTLQAFYKEPVVSRNLANSMPTHLAEIYHLELNESQTTLANLAARLRDCYSVFPVWHQVVWHNVVDSLFRVDATSDAAEMAPRTYGYFLREIHLRSNTHLGSHIISWLCSDPDFTPEHPFAHSKCRLLVYLLRNLVELKVISWFAIVRDFVLSSWNGFAELLSLYQPPELEISDCRIVSSLIQFSTAISVPPPMITATAESRYRLGIASRDGKYAIKRPLLSALGAMLQIETYCQNHGHGLISEDINKLIRNMLSSETFKDVFFSQPWEDSVRILTDLEQCNRREIYSRVLETLGSVVPTLGIQPTVEYVLDSFNVWRIPHTQLYAWAHYHKAEPEKEKSGASPYPHVLLDYLLFAEIGCLAEDLLCGSPPAVLIELIRYGLELISHSFAADDNQGDDYILRIVRLLGHAWTMLGADYLPQQCNEGFGPILAHSLRRLSKSNGSETVPSRFILPLVFLSSRSKSVWNTPAAPTIINTTVLLFKTYLIFPGTTISDTWVDCIHCVLAECPSAWRSHAQQQMGFMLSSVGRKYIARLGGRHLRRIQGLFPSTGSSFSHLKIYDREGTSSPSPFNTWDLMDHPEALSGASTSGKTILSNSNPIDLSHVMISRLGFNQAPIARLPRGRRVTKPGRRFNFDFEVPTRSQSPWARDYRRSRFYMQPRLTAVGEDVFRAPVPPSTLRAKRKTPPPAEPIITWEGSSRPGQSSRTQMNRQKKPVPKTKRKR